jgi:hypothetical protein
MQPVPFPARLVPNSIAIAVPWQPSNLIKNQPSYYERAKKLSDLGVKRSLKLSFVRHPVEDVDIDCYHSALNAPDSPLRLRQMGFRSAYEWYRDDLVSGVIPVTIAADHQVRSRSRWFEDADSWLITSFVCDSDAKLRQQIDFSIVLKPHA